MIRMFITKQKKLFHAFVIREDDGFGERSTEGLVVILKKSPFMDTIK